MTPRLPCLCWRLLSRPSVLPLACRWEGLGWRTLRWQSNVVREASLTVTMGAADSPTPVGPRGGDEAVVQLTYNYGSAPIVHQESGGFEGLVVGAGDEDAREMRDPDEYTVTLV